MFERYAAGLPVPKKAKAIAGRQSAAPSEENYLMSADRTEALPTQLESVKYLNELALELRVSMGPFDG